MRKKRYTICRLSRVVHHAVILELPGPSYRSEMAAKRNSGGAINPEQPEQK